MGLHIFGVGRLVADPIQPPGGPAKFRVAVDGYNRSTKTREATFWDCIAWAKTAETIMKYTGKGKQVAVTGELIRRKYTASSGEEREVVEINIETLELLGGKGAASPETPSSTW